MKRIRLCFLTFIMSLGAGCTVGPDYQEPDLSQVMQKEWQTDEKKQYSYEQPSVSWWLQFNDQQLNDLIAKLFSSNLALKKAEQRIIQANARYGVVGADKQIQLAAALGYTHVESKNEAVSLQGLAPGSSIDVFSTGVTAGWELNIWGRTTRLLEAAEQDIQATYANYQAKQVSLSAALSLTYFEIRSLQARKETILKNIELQQKTRALAESRYQAGNGTALAVAQAGRLLESTKARIPELERALRVSQNRICTLLGLPPQQQIVKPGPMVTVPPMIGLGLPIDLLKRRPDIRESLHNFHKAVAEIGAAEATRYPSLSLSGSITLGSDTVGGMVDMDALTYSLGPELTFPLFTGHRIENLVAIRKSQAEEERLELEQKIVTALSEVEDSSEGVVRSIERTKNLEKAEKYALQSVEFSDSLYDAGLVDFFVVLDNQQKLVTLQEALLLAKLQTLSEVVSLYRALGGGWTQQIAAHANQSIKTTANSTQQRKIARHQL